MVLMGALARIIKITGVFFSNSSLLNHGFSEHDIYYITQCVHYTVQLLVYDYKLYLLAACQLVELFYIYQYAMGHLAAFGATSQHMLPIYEALRIVINISMLMLMICNIIIMNRLLIF